jgi:hypothetical protein
VRMRSIAESSAFALVAVGLWLLWNVEHESTGIRAPWTGATYVASACGFVAAGYVGTGWRALLIAAVAAAAAVLLLDPLIGNAGDSGDCDPGCISTEAAASMAASPATFLAALGISLRRVVGRLRTAGVTA